MAGPYLGEGGWLSSRVAAEANAFKFQLSRPLNEEPTLTKGVLGPQGILRWIWALVRENLA